MTEMKVNLANVGKAVAARVGARIREVRTKLGLTQAQLAAPEFSISYISAIERGKIRPSLKALSILAKRLDVPMTFLLEEGIADTAAAQAKGYGEIDGINRAPNDTVLKHTKIMLLTAAEESAELRRRHLVAAAGLLQKFVEKTATTDQYYQYMMMTGRLESLSGKNGSAAASFEDASNQAERMGEPKLAITALLEVVKAFTIEPDYSMAQLHLDHANKILEAMAVKDNLLQREVSIAQGELQYRLGKYTASAQSFHDALKLMENLPDILLHLAQQYADAGMHYSAQDYLDRLEKIIAPDWNLDEVESATIGLAEAYYRLKKFSPCRRYLEQVLESAATNVSSRANSLLSLILVAEHASGQEIGLLVEARDRTVTAMKLAGENGELIGLAYSALAQVLIAQGADEVEIREAFASACEAHPDNLRKVDILVIYADWLEKSGHGMDAAKIWRQIYELNSRGDED